MAQDLFVTIKARYNTFTKAERSIADYILCSAKTVLYMSISELATACGVGDTSVFRFCRHVGKVGYQDFKVDLAQAVSEMNAQPMIQSCIVSAEDAMDVMIQKVLNNDIAVLHETYQLIDPSALVRATRWLTEAQHICFFGVGASSASALEARNRFLRVCPKAECTLDARMQMMRASTMNESDVAILFSYSGATKDTLVIAQAAKDAGARTICVSRYAESPLAALCDLLFLCGGNEGPLQSGSLNVKTSQHFLMEVLYIAYCQANPEECEANLARTTAFLQRDKL
ncbi:MAG: MurR/RpiR family transcriptional regulator [Eubacteriales bacterium]|nr:MurR/RpiR family transcriptional regulator [Eubacteriales bacterium]